VKVERRSDSSISTFDPSLNRQNADERLSMLPKKETPAMGHHLNEGAEGGRRIWDIPTIGLFSLVTSTGLIGVPLFGYVHGYTKLDWALAGALYIISGLGITVGYHRMISHRSFRCPNWVKVVFLVAGSWAMENSALKWSANHARHHARVDQEEDPYNAMKGFWYSHCVWFFMKSPYKTERYAPWLRQDPIVMWRHRWYVPLLLSGMALPFSRWLCLQLLDRWCGLFYAGRCREDLPRAELHVLHQFRLSPMGKPAIQSGQFQSGQLVGLADHAGRGIP
jgi:hypothetical protein